MSKPKRLSSRELLRLELRIKIMQRFIDLENEIHSIASHIRYEHDDRELSFISCEVDKFLNELIDLNAVLRVNPIPADQI